MRLSTRVLAIAGASLSLVPLLAASPASAADAAAAAPKLSVSGPSLGRIANEKQKAHYEDLVVAVWSIVSPGYAASSSAAGTITYTDRDAFTGKVRGKLTVPVAAGQVVRETVGQNGVVGTALLYPSTSISCSYLTSTCGDRHRLPEWSVQRIDVQATDAAGAKSAVRSFYAVVWPAFTGPQLGYF